MRKLWQKVGSTMLLVTLSMPLAPIATWATTGSGYIVQQTSTALIGQHIVQSGDTLFLIAKAHGITVETLQLANKLTTTAIYPGQTLRIPTTQVQKYSVQSGDTLYLLAKQYNSTIDYLISLNGLTSTGLWVGQSLLLPVSPALVGSNPSAPTPVAPAPVTTTPISGQTNIPMGGSWGKLPEGVVLYRVQQGDNLWLISQKFKTTAAAISTTNHLHTDIMQVNQPLFILPNSTLPVTIPYPIGPQKAQYGEVLDWQYASWIFDTSNVATIKDLETGRSFRVIRYGGSNHADCEPLTAGDTAIMKKIFGGQWSWAKRAVLVTVDGKVLAGSMAGMPHSYESITDNDFAGHFDLYFLNSLTHFSNAPDDAHQQLVMRAGGY